MSKLKAKREKTCKAPDCSKVFNPSRSTQKVCSVPCAIVVGKTATAKAKDKEARKAKSDYYKNSLPWQHKQTQPAFNEMRRLEELLWFLERGQEPECISCGKIKMDWCCGHFKTVGAQSGLRYDPDNTKLQCNRYCNMGLSGNIDGNKSTRGYKAGLVERFGDDEAKRIVDHCETTTAPVKFTCQQLEALRAECRKKTKALKSHPLINSYLK